MLISAAMVEAITRKPSHPVRTIVLGMVVLVVGGLLWRGFGPRASSELHRALERRGRLLVVGSVADREALPSVPGTSFVDSPADRAFLPLLRQQSSSGLVHAMAAAHVDGVLLLLPVAPSYPTISIGSALASYGVVDGLVGTYLTETMALYTVDRTAQMPPRYGTVLAAVARRLLAGESPPRLRSFPTLLRRVQHVEVMVLLRAGPRPRLWRSARGSSIARAFLTATRVARRRWQEREQSMGEPLEDALPKLVVEVALLAEDGEIGTRERRFIDRVVTEQHGIAYEHKGGWRYLLPDATREQGQGSATRALSKLLEDNGLGADGYKDPLVRVTRLRVQSLAVSPASHATGSVDPLAVPEDPGDLLEP